MNPPTRLEDLPDGAQLQASRSRDVEPKAKAKARPAAGFPGAGEPAIKT